MRQVITEKLLKFAIHKLYREHRLGTYEQIAQFLEISVDDVRDAVNSGDAVVKELQEWFGKLRHVVDAEVITD